MATRSTIAYEAADGSIKSIYCHYDGYISHNGVILQKHYNSIERVTALVSLGNLSVLNPILKPTEEHSFDNRQTDVCVFYGRDRGESGQEPKTYRNLEFYRLSANMEEYNYLFKDGAWHLLSGRYWFLLSTISTEDD
jgi:hypothetical protein